MAKEIDLFDLPREEFETSVRWWALPAAAPYGAPITERALRRVVITLASLLWILGQRVKKLEEEE